MSYRWKVEAEIRKGTTAKKKKKERKKKKMKERKGTTAWEELIFGLHQSEASAAHTDSQFSL